MKPHVCAVGLTASLLLVAVSAEAQAFGFSWPVAEPRLEPSLSSEHASRRAVEVTVSPRSVGVRSTFAVRFEGRARLGLEEGRRRGYRVALRSRRNAVACLVNPDNYATRGRRGRIVSVRFDPDRFKGGRWCPGIADGRVFYYDTYACPAFGRCEKPEGFRGLRRLVGRFSLTVH